MERLKWNSCRTMDCNECVPWKEKFHTILFTKLQMTLSKWFILNGFSFFFLFLSFPFFDIYFAFIVARLTIEQTEFYIFFPRCIGILSACWQNSNLTNNLIILKKRENKTIFFSQTTHSKQTVLNFHLAKFKRRENVQTIRYVKILYSFDYLLKIDHFDSWWTLRRGKQADLISI